MSSIPSGSFHAITTPPSSAAPTSTRLPGLIPEPAIDAYGNLPNSMRVRQRLSSDEQRRPRSSTASVRRAQQVLGTASDAVAVVAGASEGLGQVASLLEPEHGTVRLVGSDFPSVTYPWLAAAQRRGMSLRFVEDRADRDLTQDLVDAVDPGDGRRGLQRGPVRDGHPGRRHAAGGAAARGRRPRRRGRDAARRCGGRRHHWLGCGRAGDERLQVAVLAHGGVSDGARSGSGAPPPPPRRLEWARSTRSISIR